MQCSVSSKRVVQMFGKSKYLMPPRHCGWHNCVRRKAAGIKSNYHITSVAWFRSHVNHSLDGCRHADNAFIGPVPVSLRGGSVRASIPSDEN